MRAAPVGVVLYGTEISVVEILETKTTELLATSDFEGLLQVMSALFVANDLLENQSVCQVGLVHLCVEDLQSVDMDARGVVDPVLGGLVTTAHMDLSLLELHAVVAEV